MKLVTKEIQVALVAIVGIIILFFGLQFLKGLSIFSTNDTYYAAFDDVTGLSVSSPVLADGYKVGVVRAINFDYSRKGATIISMEIDKNMRIPKGTTCELASDLLGNVQILLLQANNPLEKVAVGDTIKGGKQESTLAKLSTMMPTIEKMVPKIDSILTSLNLLLADPSIANSLHNIEGITNNLNTTSRDLNVLMASVNRRVPGILDKTDVTMANAQQISDKLNGIDVAGTMAKVDATLANVEQMTKALNSREGTLGLLMHDPTLYLNLNSTMQSADSLLIDLRQHPKRYVHFSLFGRKDK